MNKLEQIKNGMPSKQYQDYKQKYDDLDGLNGFVINSSSLSDIDEEKKDSGSAARFKWNHKSFLPWIHIGINHF